MTQSIMDLSPSLSSSPSPNSTNGELDWRGSEMMEKDTKGSMYITSLITVN